MDPLKISSTTVLRLDVFFLAFILLHACGASRTCRYFFFSLGKFAGLLSLDMLDSHSLSALHLELQLKICLAFFSVSCMSLLLLSRFYILLILFHSNFFDLPSRSLILLYLYLICCQTHSLSP